MSTTQQFIDFRQCACGAALVGPVEREIGTCRDCTRPPTRGDGL